MKKAALYMLIAMCTTAGAQDMQFTNVNQSLLALNPSFAGSNGGIRNQLVYRNQWPNISSTYVKYADHLDCYIKRIKAGVALSGESESQADIIVTNGFGITYAQYLEFSEGALKIIPSVQAFYKTIEYNYRYLTFGSGLIQQYPGSLLGDAKIKTMDFNAGLLFSLKEKLYAGATVFHVTQPNIGATEERPLDRRYNFHTSYSIIRNYKHLVQVMGILSSQASFTDARLLANALISKHFVAGLGYGSGDNFYTNVGYRARYFCVGYSYDFTVSKLSANVAGSHELQLSVNVRPKAKRNELSTFEQF